MTFVMFGSGVFTNSATSFTNAKSFSGDSAANVGQTPVNPVGGEYAIGTPLFDKAVIHLPNGRDFNISVRRSRHDAYIIKAMRLNGRKYTDYTLTHATICQGGLWEINL